MWAHIFLWIEWRLYFVSYNIWKWETKLSESIVTFHFFQHINFRDIELKSNVFYLSKIETKYRSIESFVN